MVRSIRGRGRFVGLWRDVDFLKLWAALSISLVGSQLTLLALPLIAVLTLNASATQMGLLAAAGRVPYLVISLPIGVLVDRVHRRPLLIVSDLGSAALLLSVPAAAAIGQLRLPHLYLVAFGVGAFGVLSEVAHRSYAPSLVGRERLVEGNSKLMVSYSAAASAGPGLGGLLIQFISAPLTLLVDAVSFLVSAGLVRTIARPEPPLVTPARAEPLRREIGAGLRALLGHALLRPLIIVGTVAALFKSAIDALYVLYVSQDLSLNPATIGLLFTIGGLCAIPGAVLAPWAARRFGVGWAIIGGWSLAALAWLLVPLAAGPWPVAVALLATGRALDGLTEPLANIHQWSLRQAVTPDDLQGRVNASHRFFIFGAGALGGLVGGMVGGAIGLRPTLLACAIGVLLARSSLILTPVRRLHEQPTRAERSTARGLPAAPVGDTEASQAGVADCP